MEEPGNFTSVDAPMNPNAAVPDVEISLENGALPEAQLGLAPATSLSPSDSSCNSNSMETESETNISTSHTIDQGAAHAVQTASPPATTSNAPGTSSASNTTATPSAKSSEDANKPKTLTDDQEEIMTSVLLDPVEM